MKLTTHIKKMFLIFNNFNSFFYHIFSNNLYRHKQFYLYTPPWICVTNQFIVTKHGKDVFGWYQNNHCMMGFYNDKSTCREYQQIHDLFVTSYMICINVSILLIHTPWTQTHLGILSVIYQRLLV